MEKNERVPTATKQEERAGGIESGTEPDGGSNRVGNDNGGKPGGWRERDYKIDVRRKYVDIDYLFPFYFFLFII